MTYPTAVGPPTGTVWECRRIFPNPQVYCVHQRLGKCALLRGHYEYGRVDSPLLYRLIFGQYLGKKRPTGCPDGLCNSLIF